MELFIHYNLITFLIKIILIDLSHLIIQSSLILFYINFLIFYYFFLSFIKNFIKMKIYLLLL